MLYTTEQLLQIYNSPQSGWIMVRNDDVQNPLADVSSVVPASGAVESDGVWKLHLSIAPEDMAKAIPIIHAQFCHRNTPPMAMKVASRGLLAEDHQSGKEVALIFDRATETSPEGRQKILLFLSSLAVEFERAGIKPEEKPPLTIETETQVRANGSAADKKNIERGKYDATIKFRENERLSYFNYRDEMELLFDDNVYDDMVAFAAPQERQRMIKRSEFDQWNRANHPQYKHNPLKRKDDFLYGLVLERQLSLSPRVPNANVAILETSANVSTDSRGTNQALVINASSKEDFLKALEAKVKEQSFTRADILDLFSQIKKRDGNYSYIHQQGNPMWDRVRLFFKSSVSGQGENSFWHTATYQKAVKLLKEAYVARGVSDLSDQDRQQEANAFIDYVIFNPVSYSHTNFYKSYILSVFYSEVTESILK